MFVDVDGTFYNVRSSLRGGNTVVAEEEFVVVDAEHA